MNKRMNRKLYDFKAVEERWRPYWASVDLYRTGNDPDKPKYYILDYFPYPSGDGLSVGHCRNYVPTCVDARYHRMRGFNVLHPMGWDAFGLPAENYAIAHNIQPRESSRRFSDTYRRQLKLIECSYDWSREISSTHPDFYRWTQWFFLLLYRRGLAYQATGSQWWCPKDKTILANEQVENGRCWRCGTLVVRRELRQWYFKITDYADRLLADLDDIDWPEPIKMMQRHWIGRSEGSEVVFRAGNESVAHEIEVFTTRPDTLFGATFLVLAPEHPLVAVLTTAERKAEVQSYVENAVRMKEIDRMAFENQKSGVWTGAHAAHPLTAEPIPIWIADYVLMGYGTGAIMGVPAHDERDFEFATRHDLPVVEVVRPDSEQGGTEGCFTGYGVLVNSGEHSGLTSEEASERIVADLEARGLGGRQITYRMRDWLISRQRYWGAPIPIVHCRQCGNVPVPEEELPVRLPEIDEFAPTGDGRSPLARITPWVNTDCPSCGGPAERETDTMDGFACSSWYYLRFTSPRYDEGPFEPEAMSYWMPVDTYVGGAEHAVMHLLYSRFWTKVMCDAGLVPFTEPFTQLRNQGMLLSPMDGQRMSKSKGNVITPDEVVHEYGTDALRAYVMFLGPFDAEVMWDDAGIKGIARFLDRFWRLATEIDAKRSDETGDSGFARRFERRRHQIIKRLTGEMEQFRYNTAIAALMEYLNYLISVNDRPIDAALWKSGIETLTLLMAPFTPFIAEEVWQRVLGHGESIHLQPWPSYDEAAAADEWLTVVVQVNGKLRDRLRVAADINEEALGKAAMDSANVQRHIANRDVRRIIVRPGRLVNIVV